MYRFFPLCVYIVARRHHVHKASCCIFVAGIICVVSFSFGGDMDFIVKFDSVCAST